MELKEIAIIFINAIATTFGFSGSLYAMYLVLTKKQFNMKDYIRIYTILYFVNIIIGFTFLAYLPLAYGVISFFVFGKKRNSILMNILLCISTIGIFFILMALDNVIVLLMRFPAEKIMELRHTIYYNVCNALIFINLTIIAVFIINIISKFIQNIKMFDRQNKTKSDVRMVLLITSSTMFFVIVIVTTWFAAMSDAQYGILYTWFSIIISVLLGLFIGFSLYIVAKTIKQNKREMEIKHNKEITELYRNEIKNMYDDVRDFKHDYMKIYTSMSILIEQNRMEELKKYFYNEIMPLQKSIFEDTQNSCGVTFLEDYIIQGMVYNYIIKAKNNNIHFCVNLTESIPKMTGITSLELSRILGILLDNAFEAALDNTDIENRKVIFAACIRNEDIIYIVKNKYGYRPDIAKLFSHDYSTKGSKHGRGLAIAKRIIDEHEEALMNIEIQQEWFVAKVLLNNEKIIDTITNI